MISITKATVNDCETISRIGKISVEKAHRHSCSAEDMNIFLEKNYNSGAIQEELGNEQNIYHIIHVDGRPAGFSKIVFDAGHPNIKQKNITKLDRIYLLDEYVGLKLGLQLLQFNIELAKTNNQSALWLFTWVGNERAINFYLRSGFTIVGTHMFMVTEKHFNENHQMLLNFLEVKQVTY